MIQRQIEIINQLGLHARAAAKFVTLASQFQSNIHVLKGATRVNGKSIMGVMMLAAAKGTLLDLEVEGADQEEALEKLSELISNRFGEEN